MSTHTINTMTMSGIENGINSIIHSASDKVTEHVNDFVTKVIDKIKIEDDDLCIKIKNRASWSGFFSKCLKNITLATVSNSFCVFEAIVEFEKGKMQFLEGEVISCIGPADSKILGKFTVDKKTQSVFVDSSNIILEISDGVIFMGQLNENLYFQGKVTKYKDGEKIFEGVYDNGCRHGHGTEYDANGMRVFDGCFINGERYGKGNFLIKNNEGEEKLIPLDFINGFLLCQQEAADMLNVKKGTKIKFHKMNKQNLLEFIIKYPVDKQYLRGFTGIIKTDQTGKIQAVTLDIPDLGRFEGLTKNDLTPLDGVIKDINNIKRKFVTCVSSDGHVYMGSGDESKKPDGWGILIKNDGCRKKVDFRNGKEIINDENLIEWKQEKGESIPEEYLDAISLTFINDAVYLEYKVPNSPVIRRYYDRQTLKKWIQTCQTNYPNKQPTDPCTRIPINESDIRDANDDYINRLNNYKSETEHRYCEDNGVTLVSFDEPDSDSCTEKAREYLNTDIIDILRGGTGISQNA